MLYHGVSSLLSASSDFLPLLSPEHRQAELISFVPGPNAP